MEIKTENIVNSIDVHQDNDLHKTFYYTPESSYCPLMTILILSGKL